MKTIKIITILSLLSFNGMAKAEWLCQSQSSLKVGPTNTLSCGVGTSESEDMARALAQTNALNEFNQTCNQSADCANNKVNVTPMRTDCSLEDGTYKCYRAFMFEVTDELKSMDLAIASEKAKLSQIKDDAQKEKDLQNAKSEVKFSQPNPSYWSFGVGVSFGGASAGPYDATKVGYGLNLKRCFFDTICPLVGLTVGQIKLDASDESGTFFSAYTGLNVYVYKQLYLVGTIGLESQSSKYESMAGAAYMGGLGIDAIRVKSFSISIEGGIQANPNSSVDGIVNIFGNFKF